MIFWCDIIGENVHTVTALVVLKKMEYKQYLDRFEIGRDGSVRKLKTKKLYTIRLHNGTAKVNYTVRIGGKRVHKAFSVGQVVYKLFVDENYHGYIFHKDHNPYNNSVENLRPGYGVREEWIGDKKMKVIQESFIDMKEKQRALQKQFAKRKKWYEAFQNKMNDLALDEMTPLGKCGNMDFCDWCKDSGKGDPCVKALREFAKEKNITINFDDLKSIDEFL